jgi:hypothetical protein
MKFFPSEDFYIISQLKPAEIQIRLEKEITFKNTSISALFEPSGNTYFEGYSANGFFEIQPIIQGRNSFVPQIKGNTEPYLNGSRIHVKMNMMSGVIAFMCIWIGFAVLFGFGFIFQSLKNHDLSFAIIIPFGMALFGYMLALGGFKFKSVDARQKLLDMFEGAIG